MEVKTFTHGVLYDCDSTLTPLLIKPGWFHLSNTACAYAICLVFCRCYERSVMEI